MQLEYSKIISPLTGVVTDRPMYAGEMASPNAPILTVMDISQIVARANVPAEQLELVQGGKRRRSPWRIPPPCFRAKSS